MAIAPRGETPRQRQQRQRAERAIARSEESFSLSRNAQRSYGRQLRQIAGQIARIIHHYHPEGTDAPIPPGAMARIEQAMGNYATAITPWARNSAQRMVAEVNRRDLTAWQRYGIAMGEEMRRELRETQIGTEVNELISRQVDLITSLPWDAARRVQEKSLESLETGQRYPERTGEIEEALSQTYPQATEEWVKTRATLIARTETARAASVLTQARAKNIGSESYIWKTAGDWKVRASHKKLNGSSQQWAQPPLSDPPDHHSHPGQIWNCRCVALPIIPEGG
jgi:SPP1 gp7 family putative phage head morphogenesis protein